MHSTLLIWFFFVYSLLGYIVEVLYCSIGERRLVNRGFLIGPYLPIYGFGALMVLFCFYPLSSGPVTLFLISFAGTSVLEYATGFLAEKLFKIRLWDYSKYPFNFKGRVCLLNSTLFAILSIVVTYLLHPHIANLIAGFDRAVLEYGAMAILLLFAIDSTKSILHMSIFQRQLSEFREKKREIESRLRILREFKENKMLEGLRIKLDTELDELRLHLSFSAKRILDAFPSLTSNSEEKRLVLDTLRKTIGDHALQRRFQELRKRRKKRDE